MLGSTRTFGRRLLDWYGRARRDLPWRECQPGSAGPDPYHVLVSEAMLQQTQVSTVIPYFKRFIARFSFLADLAAADEQEVLRLWQGLGYYSRARNLRAAAQLVVSEFGGELPQTVERLLQLPGVGRYTAGAIASIAIGATRAELWRRAEEILPAARVGDFNSALMELGATVCVPRSPQCHLCPVRQHCAAREAGVAGQVPVPRKAKPTPLLHRHVFCIRRNGRWLIEQRPLRGRWAGLWQFVTREAAGGDAAPDPAALPVPVGSPARIGSVTHALTHRRYHFAVYRCDALPDVGCRARGTGTIDGETARAWVTLQRLNEYPLPRPHLKVAEMLTGRGHLP
jgi:A/G-specific adenine glycosylase